MTEVTFTKEQQDAVDKLIADAIAEATPSDKKFTEEQQVLVDKLVGDARTKARDKEKTRAADQAAKDKKTAAAVSQTARQELETLNAGKTKALEEMAQGMLEDAVKQMGETAKTAVEGLPGSMVAIEKLKWLRANEKLFQAPGDGVGTPRGPKADSTTGVQPQNTKLRM